jgi:hypothetical protein
MTKMARYKKPDFRRQTPPSLSDKKATQEIVDQQL